MSDAVREAARALLAAYDAPQGRTTLGSIQPHLAALRAALALDRPEKGGGEQYVKGMRDAMGHAVRICRYKAAFYKGTKVGKRKSASATATECAEQIARDIENEVKDATPGNAGAAP